MGDAVRPRLGFLGVGWIGRARMRSVMESGLAEVAALADPSPEMRAAAAELAPDAKVCGSMQELLEEELDGAVIATPSALHAEQSMAFLQRGVPVFCQKPLGRSAHESRRVVELARVKDRLLGVDLVYRHTRALAAVQGLVASGELGDVYALDLVFHNAYGPDKAWFYERALSGGGCVMDLGIHLVDAALWIAGFPEVRGVRSRLFAKGRPMQPEGVEDYAIAELDLGSAVARIACSWNLAAGRDAVIEVHVHGTRGGAVMRNVNGSFYDFVAERHRGTSTEALVEPPDEWGGRAIVSWVEGLRDGGRFDPAADELVTVSRVLDAIYAQ